MVLAIAILPAAFASVPKPNRYCERCRIHIRLLATVGRGSDPVSLADHSMPAPRNDGFIAVADTHEPGSLTYFGGDGRYIGTEQRRGAGPGELSGFVQGVMFGPGDSLYIVDIGNRRITITVPFDTLPRRSRHLPLPALPHSASVMRDGRILLQGFQPTPSRVGQLFHVVESDGSVRSFGSPHGVYERGRPADQFRAVTLDERSGEFIAGHLNQLRLERWRLTGELTGHFTLKREWFTEWQDQEEGAPFEVAPAPRLLGLWLENEQRLWLVAHVADRDWRPRRVRGEQRLPPAQKKKLYDTIIEVVHPTTGDAIKRARYNGVLIPTNTPGLFKVADEDEAGNVSLSLVRLVLVDP